MSFQNKTQFGSSKSSGKEVVHVNLVRTVRTEQLPIRRAKGSETDRGGETEFGKMNIGHGSQVLGAIKSRVGEVRSILGRMAYKTRCTEQGLERIGEQMGVIEQSVSESLSKAVRDEIVDEVVQVVRAGEKRRNGGRRQGNPEAHKVQERVNRLVDSVATTTQRKRNGLKRKQPDTKHKQGGFEISGAISGKNANILKFLFQKSYVGEERWSFEIGRCGEFAVTRMDIQCLSPSTTLSSKVINICVAYLYEADSDCWFLPTFFGERARCFEESASFINWLASTVDMCGLKRFHHRLHLCSKIFAPLYDRVDDHWSLLVVHLHEKKALLWDSLPHGDSAHRRLQHAYDVVTLMQKVFSCEMIMFDDVYYNFSSFPLALAEGNPTTAQKFDSGLFVVRHMQKYLQPFTYIRAEGQGTVSLFLALESLFN